MIYLRYYLQQQHEPKKEITDPDTFCNAAVFRRVCQASFIG